MSHRKRHSHRRHSLDPNSRSPPPAYSPYPPAQYLQASGPGYSYPGQPYSAGPQSGYSSQSNPYYVPVPPPPEYPYHSPVPQFGYPSQSNSYNSPVPQFGYPSQSNPDNSSAPQFGYSSQSYSYHPSVPQPEDPYGQNPDDIPKAKPRQSKHIKRRSLDPPPLPLPEPQPQFTKPGATPVAYHYVKELSKYPSKSKLATKFRDWQEDERWHLEMEVSEMSQLLKELIRRQPNCESWHPTCFSAVQFNYIFKLYDIFLREYPESPPLSFLLASILSEGPKRYNTEFLLYFSSIGKREQRRLWSNRHEDFEINLVQPPEQSKLIRDKPILGEKDTDEMQMIRVWMSLWKNYDYAFHVLKEICDKDTYMSLDEKLRDQVDRNRRGVDLVATFLHLIQHSEPASVFGSVPIETVIQYAGADPDVLIKQGLLRRYYDDDDGKKKLGLTIKGYKCTCSSTNMLLPWDGSKDA
ncbi:hypothetical protein FQN52_008159 [Onygenales sp. PD_12]|nr:hypothetical protein FQN52_008159 [Onygenales sp. PD_12]